MATMSRFRKFRLLPLAFGVLPTPGWIIVVSRYPLQTATRSLNDLRVIAVKCRNSKSSPLVSVRYQTDWARGGMLPPFRYLPLRTFLPVSHVVSRATVDVVDESRICCSCDATVEQLRATAALSNFISAKNEWMVIAAIGIKPTNKPMTTSCRHPYSCSLYTKNCTLSTRAILQVHLWRISDQVLCMVCADPSLGFEGSIAMFHVTINPRSTHFFIFLQRHVRCMTLFLRHT